jgi:AhpD family alkylhydroperoxidase
LQQPLGHRNGRSRDVTRSAPCAGQESRITRLRPRVNRSMPHTNLPPDLPGIRGPMAFRPETAKPLNDLVDILLRGPHTLSRGERELIATVVSSENDCRYCQTIHGAIAAHHLENESLVVDVKCDSEQADVSDKMKALLAIARHVATGGKHVTADDVARARAASATSRSTTLCSSPRSSACAIATSMGWQRGHLTTRISTGNARPSSRRTATPRPRSSKRRWPQRQGRCTYAAGRSCVGSAWRWPLVDSIELRPFLRSISERCRDGVAGAGQFDSMGAVQPVQRRRTQLPEPVRRARVSGARDVRASVNRLHD